MIADVSRQLDSSLVKIKQSTDIINSCSQKIESLREKLNDEQDRLNQIASASFTSARKNYEQKFFETAGALTTYLGTRLTYKYFSENQNPPLNPERLDVAKARAATTLAAFIKNQNNSVACQNKLMQSLEQFLTPVDKLVISEILSHCPPPPVYRKLIGETGAEVARLKSALFNHSARLSSEQSIVEDIQHMYHVKISGDKITFPSREEVAQFMPK